MPSLTADYINVIMWCIGCCRFSVRWRSVEELCTWVKTWMKIILQCLGVMFHWSTSPIIGWYLMKWTIIVDYISCYIGTYMWEENIHAATRYVQVIVAYKECYCWLAKNVINCRWNINCRMVVTTGYGTLRNKKRVSLLTETLVNLTYVSISGIRKLIGVTSIYIIYIFYHHQEVCSIGRSSFFEVNNGYTSLILFLLYFGADGTGLEQKFDMMYIDGCDHILFLHPF